MLRTLFIVGSCLALVAAACAADLTTKRLAGEYVCNQDPENSIVLSADGTYTFKYPGFDHEIHTVTGKWQLNQEFGGPHPTIVLDNYNPGTNPNQMWGTYPMTVDQHGSKIRLIAIADNSLYYEKK